MKYQPATRPIKFLGVPHYQGVVINTETKTIVFKGTSMSENGINQILNTNILKLITEDLKVQRALEAQLREIEVAAQKSKDEDDD